MVDQRELCRNDVWILQAMDARKGRQTSLVDLISHANAVNRAIPNFPELCRAVFRLRALELIVTDNEKCEVTKYGRKVLAACRGRNFMDENDRIAEYLGAGAWERISQESCPPSDQQFVTRRRYEEALHEYYRRF